MELEKTIRWIRHADLLEFMQSETVIDSEWITVHRREESVFESVLHMPFLLGPRKLHSCLDKSSWGPQSRTMPTLVFPERHDFLPKKFARFYPDARFAGGRFDDPNRGPIARLVVERSDDIARTKVDISVSMLLDFLTAKNLRLLLGIKCDRYSERTLSELRLDDDSWEVPGRTFHYSMWSRKVVGISGGSRQMFSTITGVLGRKLVSF